MNNIASDISKTANDLRLQAFAHYSDYINSARPFDENLLALLKEQAAISECERIKRRIRYAGFPIIKTLDTFEMTKERFPHLNLNELQELASCRFIEEKADVVAVGPAGHGKTHAALAIGYEAIRHGYNVRFKRAAELVTEMTEAKSEKRLSEYTRTLNRCNLLIIDEVGYLPYDTAASNFLFQIISARYETASTFYTTNYPFSQWTQFIKNENVVSAIVSRIAHSSIILNMNGPKTWRLDHARSRTDGGLHE